MNYVALNNIAFDVTVAISDIEESFNVLHGDNAGRVKTGLMVLDPIGTYIGHKITFFDSKSREAFDALWDFLIAHSLDTDGVLIEAVDNQKSIAYQAYYSSGSRSVRSIDRGEGITEWSEIEINFIPMRPQVTP